MLPRGLKKQVLELPAEDRLALMSAIITSLQQEKPIDPAERSAAINEMRGLLATNKPAPSDEEVETMLEDALAEKYLQ
ncbi:hypothetical protein [Leptolyngbya sp. NIES-2104]|uniref:hypothetical protein n=1 Tax=Leptolyngbya sp. NIES-2104 TaxID=1552121 RepID=UPI0006EC6028|nr:hypothetical protein [Leptolyngbya sp. NIES-2104]GAP93756.1 hypothetical protein NIES2104_02640 [Leptolyngbya sp. NIES-2104]